MGNCCTTEKDQYEDDFNNQENYDNYDRNKTKIQYRNKVTDNNNDITKGDGITVAKGGKVLNSIKVSIIENQQILST